ncbi:MAG: carboxypeptidase regulatory-like domain-containing protein, partial [Acidobacteriia bacterium]|nr:carboxypeptidase regulatory-like domain-containing protein [Terriglobia bacterium]
MRNLLLRSTCLLVFSAVAGLWAQTVDGTLSGRITSADGNPVSNAAITVTNIQSNTSQKALTGADGAFSISALPPGSYKVDVESAGYKRSSQQNVELTATGPATVNITLEAGSTNETVEIKGTAPMTQTDNGEVSVGQDTRVVHEIPVIDRNHQQLVQFETGVTPPQAVFDFAADPERNRFYSVNGQFPYLNQYFVDGTISQEPYRGTSIRVVPEAMIQQFNISTANLSADKGFTNGAYVTDNSRGGTNALHGDLFEFFSGNPLRTRSYFDTLDNNSPRFTYNQFGASIGGPIVRDKLFFFGSYEGNYNRGDNTQINTVPVAGALTGNFNSIPGVTVYNPYSDLSNTGAFRTAFPGNVIPAGFINPAAAAIASYIPAPNQPGLVNNYISNAPYQLDYQKGDGRVDFHISDHTSAFLRYGYSNNHVLETSPFSVIGVGTRDRLLADNAVIGLDHAFGDNLITSFKFGYNRYDLNLGPYGNSTPLANTVGFTGFSSGLIGINIPGMGLLGTPANLPENPRDNTFNWVWDWSYHTAKHSFKAGVDVRRIRADGWLDSPLTTLFGAGGTAYFEPGATLLNNGATLSPLSEFYNSYAAFLLGAPTQIGAVNYYTTPTIRQTQYGVWLGDNIHVLHRVTLDLGVRYEIFGNPTP